ncbi:Hint domain-containing protein [Roseobacteraceae bacterium S113]
MAGRASGITPASERAMSRLVAQTQEMSLRDAAKTCEATGLLPGTIIYTMDGEMPVEHLCAGDRIITRDAGAVELIGLEVRVARAAPLRVQAGSLGHHRPETDAVLAPGTKLLLRDWRAKALFGCAEAMVPAERLVDDTFVTREPEQELRLYNLVFAAPHVIYASGLEVGVEPLPAYA